MTWPRCKLLGKWLTTLKSNLLSITLNILSIGLYAFEDLSFSAMIINIHSQWMLIKLMLFFLKNKFPTPKRGTLSTFHFQSLQKKKKKTGLPVVKEKKKKERKQKHQNPPISSSITLVTGLWKPQETLSDYQVCMFDNIFSTSFTFTFTRCTKMKNSQVRASRFLLHGYKTALKEFHSGGFSLFSSRNWCLMLLVNSFIICSLAAGKAAQSWASHTDATILPWFSVWFPGSKHASGPPSDLH